MPPCSSEWQKKKARAYGLKAIDLAAPSYGRKTIDGACRAYLPQAETPAPCKKTSEMTWPARRRNRGDWPFFGQIFDFYNEIPRRDRVSGSEVVRRE